MKKQFMS